MWMVFGIWPFPESNGKPSADISRGMIEVQVFLGSKEALPQHTRLLVSEI